MQSDHQAQPGHLHGGAEIGGELGGEGGEVDRLEIRLHATGLDARKIEQRIDELEQANAVAMGDLHQRPVVAERVAFGLGEHVLQRPEHQGQRRAEFVADVGEERRLGAIDLRQRLGAAALLLVGVGVGEARTRSGPAPAR